LEAIAELPFYAQGLNFSCKRCSSCCRFEAGYVFLSEKDVSILGAALSIPVQEFISSYCRWVPGENGKDRLSLKEKPNNDCIFWKAEKEGCSLYESRPLQCRAYPFWLSILDSKKNWGIHAKDCPGMNHGAFHSADSIKNWLTLRQMEPIISRDMEIVL
jgi:Fe-S-cluster containining protein